MSIDYYIFNHTTRSYTHLGSDLGDVELLSDAGDEQVRCLQLLDKYKEDELK